MGLWGKKTAGNKTKIDVSAEGASKYVPGVDILSYYSSSKDTQDNLSDLFIKNFKNNDVEKMLIMFITEKESNGQEIHVDFFKMDEIDSMYDNGMFDDIEFYAFGYNHTLFKETTYDNIVLQEILKTMGNSQYISGCVVNQGYDIIEDERLYLTSKMNKVYTSMYNYFWSYVVKVMQTYFLQENFSRNLWEDLFIADQPLLQLDEDCVDKDNPYKLIDTKGNESFLALNDNAGSLSITKYTIHDSLGGEYSSIVLSETIASWLKALYKIPRYNKKINELAKLTETPSYNRHSTVLFVNGLFNNRLYTTIGAVDNNTIRPNDTFGLALTDREQNGNFLTNDEFKKRLLVLSRALGIEVMLQSEEVATLLENMSVEEFQEKLKADENRVNEDKLSSQELLELSRKAYDEQHKKLLRFLKERSDARQEELARQKRAEVEDSQKNNSDGSSLNNDDSDVDQAILNSIAIDRSSEHFDSLVAELNIFTGNDQYKDVFKK